MRLSRIFLFLFLCGFSLLTHAQSIVCHVTGRVEDPKEKNVLIFEDFDALHADRFIKVAVRNGRFICDIQTQQPKCYTVVLESEYEKGSMRVADFIIEPTDVHITIPRATDEGDDVIRISSRGPENTMAMEYIAFRDSLFKAYEPRLRSLEATPPAAADTSREERALGQSAKEKYEKLKDEMGLKKAEWLAEHPSFYSLSRIYRDLRAFTPPQTRARMIEVYYNLLANLFPQHPYHSTILNEAAAAQLKPGFRYIDYIVPDGHGNDVMLSSLYKGKLIYIDLWASWCGPCRRHAKSLIPVYNKYKDRGFQIISFAREMKEGAMEAAAAQDGYPWTSTAEINDKYKIWEQNGVRNSAGGGYLIDEHGIILAVYPSAEELEAILKRRL